MATARPLPPAQEVAWATPGARAAVLARLWGCLAREDIPGLVSRYTDGSELVIDLAGDRQLRGPADVAEAFAVGEPGMSISIDGEPRTDPGGLIREIYAESVALRFADELDNSVHNLALARAAQPEPDRGPAVLSRLLKEPAIVAMAEIEQSVVDGHPLHPCCRTRIGMTDADIAAYAPEHHKIVNLVRVAVPPDRWLRTGAGADNLLLHPWQYQRLLLEFPELRLLESEVPAYPLMSLRTLAPLERPDIHIKTSVDILMTSAIRQISPAAVRNGPLLSGLLGPLGRQCGMTVLPELAGGAMLDPDGSPNRRVAMLIRQAPRPEPGELLMPVAALSVASIASGRPLLSEAVSEGFRGDPLAFLADLTATLVPPLFRMLAVGIALEAHGQNTLIGLRAGRPTRILYRDLGGIRVSGARLSQAGWPAPPLTGDLPSDEPEELRTKLFAGLIGTVLPELVATVCRNYDVEPKAAWSAIAEVLRDLRATQPSDDLDAMCTQPVPMKALMAMRLSARPLTDQWCTCANPLAELV
jgi:siderophore synthetase component